MINSEKGFKRLALVAIPFWVWGGFLDRNGFDDGTYGFLVFFLVTSCVASPLTLFYLCKFFADGFRDD
ncbi:TPA: hypothetical protein DHW51_20295 [Candidatus Poribacteria bacterium]|nr:hypothetical protein [Candidatus Poribacteria bacterium]